MTSSRILAGAITLLLNVTSAHAVMDYSAANTGSGDSVAGLLGVAVLVYFVYFFVKVAWNSWIKRRVNIPETQIQTARRVLKSDQITTQTWVTKDEAELVSKEYERYSRR